MRKDFLDRINAVLTGRNLPASDAAGDLIGEAEKALTDTDEKRAALVSRRAELLLRASDSAIEMHDAEVAKATRDCERLTAQLAALRGTMREAEAAENQDVLDSKFARGQALVEDGANLLARYVEHAQEVADVVREWEARDAVIEQINQVLAAAGDPRRIPGLDERHRSVPSQTTPATTKVITPKDGWDDEGKRGIKAADFDTLKPREVNVPEQVQPGCIMPRLPEAVMLRPAGPVDDDSAMLWPPHAIARQCTRAKLSRHEGMVRAHNDDVRRRAEMLAS